MFQFGSVLWKSLVALGYLFIFMQSLFLVTSAVLEFVFSPSFTFKYYLPLLFRSSGGGDNSSVFNLYLLLCILVQLFNFFAASVLFFRLALTSYNSKWFAYDTFSIFSMTFSVVLLTHRSLTGIDLYSTKVVSAIYKTQVSRVADLDADLLCTNQDRMGRCVKSAIYTWHQQAKCCGWMSPDDVLIEKKHGKGVKVSQKLLPPFCCLQLGPLSKVFPPNNSTSENETTTTFTTMKTKIPLIERIFGQKSNQTILPSNNCNLSSINRFRNVCSSKSEFFLNASFSQSARITFIGHPVSWPYTLLKMASVLVYTFTKKHSLLPQSRGIFAHNMAAF